MQTLAAALQRQALGRAHDGQIITTRLNLRRTSDAIEITCWNRYSVLVAVALDICARAVIFSVANIVGTPGEMIQDLILERERGEVLRWATNS